MARRNPQTLAKRERELAKLEKRQRKQEKKAARSESSTVPVSDPPGESSSP
jgi:hypothetical protein